MKRRGFIAVLLIGVGTGVWWAWRNRKVRERVQNLAKEVVRRSHTVRELVRKVFKPQVASEAAANEAARIVTGLDAPEVRPLTTVDQLLRWSPDPAADPDAPFCRTYNSPLLLPPAPPVPATGPVPPTPTATTSTSATASTTTTTTTTIAAAAPATAGAPATAAGATAATAASRPRLLVCHDMMGGYLADRLVQGGADPGFFRLWQWEQVDVFVYFSHHLVTLPPPGWTAAAHRNGVRVLGTFITEWEEGRRRCEALFASPAAARAAADQLVALAVHHGFEGWLVNVENGLGRELVPHLTHFVAHLRARMAAEVGPHALVIWYDAITTEGRLAWQDGLTRLNAPFFDAADALFVNYRWQEGAPAAVAAAAGSRAAEVYMGVDVFGRGSYGGGKENCPVALAAARAAGLSAALFAPGWVYEEFDRATFELRQEAFWAAIRGVWPARPALVARLPLQSHFNTGAGRALWLEGRRVSAAPWFNLSAQDVVASSTPLPSAAATSSSAATTPASTAAPTSLQPPQPKGATVLPPAAVSPLTVRPTSQLAYTGGACLALTAPPPPPPSLSSAGPWVALHALYSAALPLDPGFGSGSGIIGIGSGSGLDLTWTAACAGSSRVGLLLRTAPAEVAGSAGCCVGLAVGPWGAGDKAVVEALRKAGYTCAACPPGAATGAVTCPLSDATTTTAASAAAAAVASGPAVPSGLPWVTYSAQLPRRLFPASGSGSSGSSSSSTAAAGSSRSSSSSSSRGAITAVGIVCYHSATAGSGAQTATAGAGAATATAKAGYFGGGEPLGPSAPFTAFLGLLSIREHRGSPTDPPVPATATVAAPSSAAGVATAPIPVAPAPPPATPPPPLTGAAVSRVRWARPTARAAAGAASSDASAAAAAASPASALLGGLGLGGPRLSGELVHKDDLLSPTTSGSAGAAAAAAAAAAAGKAHAAAAAAAVTEEDDDWERGSSGGGGAGAGAGARNGAGASGAAGSSLAGLESPIKIKLPTLLGDDEEDEEEEEEAAGGARARARRAGAGVEEEDDGTQLLTCELSWAPQFEAGGAPRHRSYHVWVHFNRQEAPAGGAAASGGRGVVPLPGIASPTGPSALGALGVAAAAGAAGADAAGGRKGAGSGSGKAASKQQKLAAASEAAAAAAVDKDSTWEVLHPDWSGAVWVGEAHVARFRLVQLEVPGWARSVSLLAQPAAADSGALGALQPLACVPVPVPARRDRG